MNQIQKAAYGAPWMDLRQRQLPAMLAYDDGTAVALSLNK